MSYLQQAVAMAQRNPSLSKKQKKMFLKNARLQLILMLLSKGTLEGVYHVLTDDVPGLDLPDSKSVDLLIGLLCSVGAPNLDVMSYANAELLEQAHVFEHGLDMALHDPSYNNLQYYLKSFMTPEERNIARVADVERSLIDGTRTPEELLRSSVIESDNDLIQLAIRYGAEMPPPIGDPNRKCEIQKFECSSEEDREELLKLRDLEMEQSDYFFLKPLRLHCKQPFVYYVARQDDVLCGSLSAVYYAHNRSMQVMWFATQTPFNPNLRGVGSNLMRTFLEDCKASRISFVFLVPLHSAIGFYEKMGFKEMLEVNPSNPELMTYMYRVITPPMPPIDGDADLYGTALQSMESLYGSARSSASSFGSFLSARSPFTSRSGPI